MIKQIPMTAEHLDLIRPEPSMAGFKANLRFERLRLTGNASAWIDTTRGEVLGLAGYIVRCPGVAWVWFLPAEGSAHLMTRVTRYFKRWVSTLEGGIRVEATVLADFDAGNRWAAMLGLERETDEPMRLWDGTADYHLYARVTGAESCSL